MKKASIYSEKQASPGSPLFRSHLYIGSEQNQRPATSSRWSKQRANAWFEKQGCIVGCNYIQSTAENPLEMWREGNFDPCVIDQELSWVADSGFNTIRVFLHPLVWMQDPKNYLSRIDWFLSIAEVYGISTILILFDAFWDLAPQPANAPLSAPQASGGEAPVGLIASDSSRYEALNSYVEGVVNFFKNDQRVLLWDLLDLNEPGNMNLGSYGNNSFSQYKPELALRFLKETIHWVRHIDPIQPTTMAPFPKADMKAISVLDNYMYHHADIISCHTCGNKKDQEKRMLALKIFGRPILCTGHMCRDF
jgi:hypothetical protein